MNNNMKTKTQRSHTEWYDNKLPLSEKIKINERMDESVDKRKRKRDRE